LQPLWALETLPRNGAKTSNAKSNLRSEIPHAFSPAARAGVFSLEASAFLIRPSQAPEFHFGVAAFVNITWSASQAPEVAAMNHANINLGVRGRLVVYRDVTLMR
jgi:hypothetical protein